MSRSELVRRLTHAGGAMSNILYNLKQGSFGTERIREQMDEAQTAWDSALQAFNEAAALTPEEQAAKDVREVAETHRPAIEAAVRQFAPSSDSLRKLEVAREALRNVLPTLEELAEKRGLSFSEAGGLADDVRAALSQLEKPQDAGEKSDV